MTTYQECTAEQRREMLAQIGHVTVLSISGGRVTPLPCGVEMPVSCGYRVRVLLTTRDTYTVQRVFVRGLREWVKAELTDIYCDQVSDAAYYASCYQSHEPGDIWAEVLRGRSA